MAFSALYFDHHHRPYRTEYCISEDDLVLVMGTIKSFANKRYITATHIRKCEDFHQALYHELKCCEITLILDRGAVRFLSDWIANTDTSCCIHQRSRPGEQKTTAASTSNPAHPSTASAYTAQTGQIASNDQFAHLPKVQREILHFIMSQPAHDDGIHVGAIARAVGGQATAISDALDKLMDDGHVYTTIDESHFNVSV